ncbi:MAG TPA: hypothetical protein VGB89_03125 [Bacteroidota bacterium]
MRRPLFVALAFLFACALLLTSTVQAKDRPGQTAPGLNKTTISGDFQYMDVNRISTPVRNNGSFNRDPGTGNAGFEWPKGTGNTANYASGLWVGGKRGGVVRVAVAEYAYEYDAGPIVATVPANPADSRWRVYSIRRGDDRTNSVDYVAWPWEDGAPVVKAADGSDSLDDTGNRIPELIGDQTIWCVYNDADVAKHTNMNTLPLGLEVQLTAFAFNRGDALGDNIFFKWKIINKSGEMIDSTFVTIWTDIDMGDSGDDLDGCDIPLGVGYTYNDGVDGVYGAQTPATGFDFLQGPLVPGAPTDTARFPDGRIFPGMKLLQMTSFIKYNNDTSPLGNPNTGQEVYFYQQGVDRNGQPILDNNGATTTFMFPGDPNLPQSSTNWIEDPGSGGDRRFMMTAGPFTMANGDEQEIVGANFIAFGADPNQSVTALKNADAAIQKAYDLNFKLAAPPLPPTVQVTALDREFVLSWGADDVLATQIEKTNTLDRLAEAAAAFDDTYDFEGYVVYQYGDAFGNSPKIVATFDRPDNADAHDYIDNGLAVPPSPGIIYDDVFDPNFGVSVNIPVKFGNNGGVRRSIKITKDLFTNNPLSNAKDYYYAVTAYTYNNESVPKTLESASNIVIARATKSVGERYTSSYLDTVTAVTHATGISEATIVPRVVDPSKLTGHTYRISIDASGPSRVWVLTDMATGSQLVTSSNLGAGQGGTPYSWPLRDGIEWIVNDVESRPNPDSSVFTDAAGGATWMQAARWGNVPPAVVDPTGSGVGIITIGSDLVNFLAHVASSFDESGLPPIEIRFGPGESQSGYRLRRAGGVGTTYVIQETNPFVALPFTVWDMSNPASPRQLTISWRDQASDALFNPPVGPDDGVEILFIYNRSYDPAGHQWPYQNEAPYTIDQWSNAATAGADADIMYAMSYGLVAAGTDAYNAPASKISVIPFKTLKTADTYSVAGPAAPTKNAEVASADVNLINAVPNPYYGSSDYERNQLAHIMRFTNLPVGAKIRIFSLAGVLVKTLDNEGPGTTVDWDLQNKDRIPVASGMYIAYVDIPGVGSKTLKLAVILAEERLDNF